MNKGDIDKKILFAAAGIEIDGASISPPDQERAIRPLGKWYMDQDRRGRYRTRKAFDKLKRLGLVEFSADYGIKKISITEKGREKALKYQIDDLRPERPKRWDKKWRMVVFNIPENLKQVRNSFRNKLKELGFQNLQNSIWVYPYECRNEINRLSEFFGIRQCVKLIEANNFDGDTTFKENFGL